jgi:esterase/lipase
MGELEYEEYNERFQPLEVRDVRSGRSLTTYISEGTGSACVVYLHGLSSFSGEAKYLSEYTSLTDLSLCIFDFEGHGKSKGEYISYGLN